MQDIWTKKGQPERETFLRKYKHQNKDIHQQKRRAEIVFLGIIQERPGGRQLKALKS